MKRLAPPILVLFALVASASFAAPACCSTESSAATNTESAEKQTTEKPAGGHALRGVILAVMPEKSALLVKHEEIPGVMRAMTMLLKVDAPTLAAAKKDQAITATLIKKDDGWWLEKVQPAAAKGD